MDEREYLAKTYRDGNWYYRVPCMDCTAGDLITERAYYAPNAPYDTRLLMLDIDGFESYYAVD